jgi:PAS domain S-box-containing protein
VLERHEIERRIEGMHVRLDELRRPSRSEARLASLAITDRIDRWGRYLYIDPQAEAILGYPQTSYMKDIGWVHYNHPEDQWRTAILWQRALAGVPCRRVEYRTQNARGQWVWLEDSFTPIRFDSMGHALVVEGCWRDITQRKRREGEFIIMLWEMLLEGKRPAPLMPRAGRPVCKVVPFPASIRAGRRRGSVRGRE